MRPLSVQPGPYESNLVTGSSLRLQIIDQSNPWQKPTGQHALWRISLGACTSISLVVRSPPTRRNIGHHTVTRTHRTRIIISVDTLLCTAAGQMTGTVVRATLLSTFWPHVHRPHVTISIIIPTPVPCPELTSNAVKTGRGRFDRIVMRCVTTLSAYECSDGRGCERGRGGGRINWFFFFAPEKIDLTRPLTDNRNNFIFFRRQPRRLGYRRWINTPYCAISSVLPYAKLSSTINQKNCYRP